MKSIKGMNHNNLLFPFIVRKGKEAYTLLQYLKKDTAIQYVHVQQMKILSNFKL